MLESKVQEAYEMMGLEIAHDPQFWETYHISYLQLKQDSENLYGLLKSSTKSKTNPYIMRHKDTKDGLTVWMAFQKAYAFGGSVKIRANELEELMLQPYNPSAYKGISNYIDEFQSWVEELDALKTRSYGDEDKKRMLLRNLMRVPNIAHLLQTCEDSVSWTFEETCNYIRCNSMIMDKVMSTAPKTATMLNTMVDDKVEPNHEDIIKKIQMMIEETSPVLLYQALSSPTMRESMNIPTTIWKELEPELREKVMEIRNSRREKEEQKKEEPRSSSLPPQYANKTPMDLVANLCAQMTQDDNYEDIEDDMSQYAFCVNTSEPKCGAHLEDASTKSAPGKIYAISDGGADACMFGTHANIASEMGRYVDLIGYDPSTTKSMRVPIVNAYLKTKANNGRNVILKINQAVYNA